MSRDPETIQREIEQARAALAETFDALAERASPKRLAERGRQRLLDKARSPQGTAIAAAVGAVTFLVAAQRIRRSRARRRDARR